jgi:hypothetical protein
MQLEILRTRAQTHTLRSRVTKDLTESLNPVEAPVSFSEREPPNPSWGKGAFEAFHYQADDGITTISLPANAELWLEDRPQAFRKYCGDEKLLEALACEVRPREAW